MHTHTHSLYGYTGEASRLLDHKLAVSIALIALSFPEAIILRKVLKPRLTATFFGVVAVDILMVGYLFNFIM